MDKDATSGALGAADGQARFERAGFERAGLEEDGSAQARFAEDGGILRPGRPLPLDAGGQLESVEIAYRTYGLLNADRSNAVLVCHALTGDQHVASPHPLTGKPGWWTQMVGPGRPLDPARHFIVCANVVGGCMGTTGPSSPDPLTGKPYGLAFPVITIADMVRAQAMLLDALGIETLLAVVGGSMGGMQALQWIADHPERLRSAVCIASAARHSAQNIALHEVGRQAIMADPDWRDGDYAGAGARPEKGLAVARMAAHITYLSEQALQRKFGRELQRDGLSWGFDADFQVESYLRHQGAAFVDRFDANSYLYITRAMDYFDLAAPHGGLLAEAFRKARDLRVCVLSFTSDWLYPTPESRHVVRALSAAGARASFLEIDSDKGHDAFLLDEPVMRTAVAGFLDAVGQDRRGAPPPPPEAARREDFRAILNLVRPGARVLDIGCGEGVLLDMLARGTGAEGRGLEISPANVSLCLGRGLSVVQGDADHDLADFPADSFDYALLSQTLQTVRQPRHVLSELLRIAGRAIVSFPNFAHWRVRWELLRRGRMPMTGALPKAWWETENIHLSTLRDFTLLCDELGLKIEACLALADGQPARPIDPHRPVENWRAESALFLLARG